MATQEVTCVLDVNCALTATQAGVSYANIRTLASATSLSAQYINVGQSREGDSMWPYYRWAIFRGGLTFDTSPLAGKLILDVTLNVYQDTSILAYPAQQAFVVVPGEDISTGVIASDYGLLLSRTTYYGYMEAATFGSYGKTWVPVPLTVAGKASINYSGYTKFGFRGLMDINNNSGPNSGIWRNYLNIYGTSLFNEPKLVATILDAPYVPFKGLFVRGDEIQAVFSIPDEGVARAWRSPDFGTTWYPISGVENAGIGDIGFDSINPQNTFLGGVNKIYKFDHADGSVYNVVEGASILGTTTEIDVDKDSSIGLIGTTSKLYKTTNWGESVHELLDHPVSALAIGGLETVAYSLPTVSSYTIYPNGDGVVGADGASTDIIDTPYTLALDKNPSLSSYWSLVRYKDATWIPPNGFIFGSWSGNFVSYNEDDYTRGGFTMEDINTSIQIAEIRICTYAARSTYPYGGINHSVRTSGTRYDGASTRALGSGEPKLHISALVKNPNTGNKWTASEINDAKFGFYLDSTASFGVSMVDQLFVEIYPEAGATEIVGTTPISRNSSYTVTNTVINLAHPSPVSGSVRQVELYVHTGMTGVKIGTFYKVGGDYPPSNGYYTCRDWQSIGDLSTGLQSFEITLTIHAGDFIGIYGTAGAISVDYGFNEEESAIRSVGGGDKIPCTNEEFEPTANTYILSIRGIVYN